MRAIGNGGIHRARGKGEVFRNTYRVNVHPDQEVRVDKNGCTWLKRGPMSVTVREGPLLAKAQEWFPECNAVTSKPKACHVASVWASQGREKSAAGEPYLYLG